jgi:hypothetical protein
MTSINGCRQQIAFSMIYLNNNKKMRLAWLQPTLARSPFSKWQMGALTMIEGYTNAQLTAFLSCHTISKCIIRQLTY